MKLADIIKVIAKELGTSDLTEINKILKSKPGIKFRILGKTLKNLGFTGQIKSISEEGIKAFMTNKVSLIRLDQIELFEKKLPTEWYVKKAQKKPTDGSAPAKAAKNKKPKKLAQADDEDDDDLDDDDDNFHDLIPKKAKKSKVRAPGKQGSKFIPLPKKR